MDNLNGSGNMNVSKKIIKLKVWCFIEVGGTYELIKGLVKYAKE